MFIVKDDVQKMCTQSVCYVLLWMKGGVRSLSANEKLLYLYMMTNL
jgi:hypothetical protein